MQQVWSQWFNNSKSKANQTETAQIAQYQIVQTFSLNAKCAIFFFNSEKSEVHITQCECVLNMQTVFLESRQVCFLLFYCTNSGGIVFHNNKQKYNCLENLGNVKIGERGRCKCWMSLFRIQNPTLSYCCFYETNNIMRKFIISLSFQSQFLIQQIIFVHGLIIKKFCPLLLP